jgi:HAD superfamily hydrolase (TIGR01509 family)
MIRGIIFDFDGLILDTEMPVYTSWVELYQEYGAHLQFSQWAKIIGTSDIEHYDPFDILETETGKDLDREVLAPKRYEREMVLCLQQPIMPGVEDMCESARDKGLKLGVASSSDRKWVVSHLTRLGLIDYFEVIHTSDDVEMTKPDPALFRITLESLELQPQEAIVFEDSPNGISAAKSAGIFTVAVPNQLTRGLPLDHADLRFDSLADTTLEEILSLIENVNIK